MGVAEQVQCVYAAIQHIREERSTVDIAEELGVSRFMVGRMIRRARDEGLIDVVPRMSDPIDAELSNALARHFGLHAAFVLTVPSERDSVARSVIANTAARLIAELVNEDDTIGLGPGRTIMETCAQVTALPTCDVVQLTGVAAEGPEESLASILALSNVAGGKMVPLHAPFLPTDAAAAAVIAAQPSVKQAFRRMDHLDIAVLTVGGWPDSSLLATRLEEAGEMHHLEEFGVVAEIGTTLLDAKGKVTPAMDGRLIGITTQQLAAVPTTLALGGGIGKRLAVVSALRSGLVDIIVTDARTAHEAIESR
jgi:DNA-binding transcriptional regulator LsrR (DeoR family)